MDENIVRLLRYNIQVISYIKKLVFDYIITLVYNEVNQNKANQNNKRKKKKTSTR